MLFFNHFTHLFETEKEIKARAEDKILRQKQKDLKKELKKLDATKKNLRFLGESLDSHFFSWVQKIKKDTILETLYQEANDKFWKLNKKKYSEL